jgi:hypothetical protein
LVALGFRNSPTLEEPKDPVLYIPETRVVKLLSLGQNNAVASVLWVRGILDYSDAMFGGKDFSWVSHLADAATSLDSLFHTPYTFIGAVTATSDADTSDFPVLRRGIQAFPHDWRLAVSFALRLSMCPLRLNQEASQVMAPFANDTTVPPYVRNIHQTFAIQAMPTNLAVLTIVENATDPRYKDFEPGLARKALLALGQKFGGPEDRRIKEIIHSVAQGEMEGDVAYQELMRMAAIHP